MAFLDPTDLQLIRLLQDQPRASHAELARLTGISISTVRRRVEGLLQSGAITFSVYPNVWRKADLGSAAAKARDLGDATLLPGLINMHTHLTLSGSMQVLHDALYDSYDEVKMMRAVEHARQSIESGVTTIRDCGTLNPIVFAIREASKQGLIAAPHVWASGDVLTSTGGYCYFFGNECDTAATICCRSTSRNGMLTILV